MSGTLPRIGLGTWKHTGDDAVEAVSTAAELGYRHIDTAQMYENEATVGEGIAAAEVPREEITVATKIHHRSLPAASHDEVVEAVQTSLNRLGLETLDLLYLHWPLGNYDPEETLGAFDELYDAGIISNIGVCNCTPELLDEARKSLNAPLFAHQVEMHPLLQQEELRTYAQKHDHNLVAYSPLAHGDIFEVPELRSIAKKHDISEAQVSLAWLTNYENVAAVPKATGEAHLRENLEAQSIELDEEDLSIIEGIDQHTRVVDPDIAPWNQ